MSLESLSLENLWIPPHVVGRETLFRDTWARIGHKLQSLSVQKAQENLFDAIFLRDLRLNCARLVSFGADGGSFSSPYMLSEHLGHELGPQLEAVSITATPLCDMDAASLLFRCTRLRSLRLHGTSCTVATFRRLVTLRATTLCRIDMSHISDLTDADLETLAHCPNLLDLRLRRCRNIFEIPKVVCARLVALDVRDCPHIGDTTLMSMADSRAPLQHLFLNENAISEPALAHLLHRCGSTLRTIDLRFKASSRAIDKRTLRTLLAMYCRGGLAVHALLE